MTSESRLWVFSSLWNMLRNAEPLLTSGAQGAESDTTSLKSSILRYREENGRTYHAYKDGGKNPPPLYLSFSAIICALPTSARTFIILQAVGLLYAITNRLSTIAYVLPNDDVRFPRFSFLIISNILLLTVGIGRDRAIGYVPDL